MKAAIAWAHTSISDYLELTKPSVTSLILMSTLVGYYMAAQGFGNILLLIHTLLGTAMVAGSAAALNHYLEIDSDGKCAARRCVRCRRAACIPVRR